MARLLCETTDLEWVQPAALVIPGADNELRECLDYGPFDLMPWLENDYY